jgi:hypothetical protein
MYRNRNRSRSCHRQDDDTNDTDKIINDIDYNTPIEAMKDLQLVEACLESGKMNHFYYITFIYLFIYFTKLLFIYLRSFFYLNFIKSLYYTLYFTI